MKGNKKQDFEPFSLVATNHAPPNIPYSVAFDTFLDEIEERTDGRVTFERFHSGSLASENDVLAAVESGVADVATVIPSRQSGKNELVDVSSLPGITPSTWVGIKALNELYETIPAMNQELEDAGVVPIGFYVAAPFRLASTKPINSFTDLEGLRVQILSRSTSLLAKELKMTPLSIPYTESYEAMTRGTIDATIFSYAGMKSYGLDESINYIWDVPITTAAGPYVMNKNVWEGLPSDIQEIIKEVANDFQADSYHEIYDVSSERVSKEEMSKSGITINEISDQDWNTFLEKAKEVSWEGWIKEMEEKGHPGQEILDTYLKLVEKYTKEQPE